MGTGWNAAAVTLAVLLSSSASQAADCKEVAVPHVDWQDCNKSKLMISGSSLDQANLAGADLSHTDLRNSSLSGANFEKASLMRSSLAGSRADAANFARIEGYRSVFRNVSARNASFASAELQRADFSAADLSGADFQKAELARADFTDAVVTGARFRMANLARANLNEAKFEGKLDLSGAFLFLTRLEGMDLSAAVGLEQWQVDQACGDTHTRLPPQVTAASEWPCPPADD